MGFLDRVFRGRQPSSSDIAKERLQLVLVHDRVKISPSMLDRMKDELITVISRYVEIEADGVEVTLIQSKRESRLVADIPVVGPVRRDSSKSSPRSREPGVPSAGRAGATGAGGQAQAKPPSGRKPGQGLPPVAGTEADGPAFMA